MTVRIGRGALGLAGKLHGDLCTGIGVAPNGDGNAALKNHAVAKRRGDGQRRFGGMQADRGTGKDKSNKKFVHGKGFLGGGITVWI